MKAPTKRSFENWSDVRKAETVGCYYCCEVQPAKNIVEKCKDVNDFTAICTCGIDSVVVYEAELDGTLDEFAANLKLWHSNLFGQDDRRTKTNDDDEK